MSRNTDFESAGNNQVKPAAGNRLVVVGGVAGVLLGSAAIIGVYFGGNGAVTSGQPLFAQAGGPPPSFGRPGMPGMPGQGAAPTGAPGTGAGGSTLR